MYPLSLRMNDRVKHSQFVTHSNSRPLHLYKVISYLVRKCHKIPSIGSRLELYQKKPVCCTFKNVFMRPMK
jgi:hypothetical protein